jgi:hypothetical protein
MKHPLLRFRLFIGWLFAFVAIICWSGVNQLLVLLPAWADTIFAIVLVCSLLRPSVAELATALAGRRTLRLISWLLGILALGAAFLWSVLAFVSESARDWLYFSRLSPIAPFSAVDRLGFTVAQRLLAGDDFPLDDLLTLLAAFGASAAAALLLALAVQITARSWRSSWRGDLTASLRAVRRLAPSLAQRLGRLKVVPQTLEALGDALAAWLVLLRGGRAFTFLRRGAGLLIGLLVAVVVTAQIDNMLMPSLAWQATSIAPRALRPVNALLRADDGTLYGGTRFGGVYRSTDGGQSWEQTGATLANTWVWDLAQDQPTGALYAATIDGVYRSADRGSSWQQVGLDEQWVISLTIDQRTGVLYAGTGIGSQGRGDVAVYKSADGLQWEQLPIVLQGSAVADLEVNPALGTLLASTTAGIFRSDDGGVSWEEASTGLTASNVWSLLITDDGNTLFAGTFAAGTNRGAIFRSTDGAQSWEEMTINAPVSGVWTLAAGPGGRALYAGTIGGILRSVDRGRTWEPTSGLKEHTAVTTLVVDPDGAVIAGTAGQETFSVRVEVAVGLVFADGLFRSTDQGITWGATGAELTSGPVEELALDSATGRLYAANRNGIYVLGPGQTQWSPAGAGLTAATVPNLAVAPGSVVYAEPFGLRLARLVEEERAWKYAVQSAASSRQDSSPPVSFDLVAGTEPRTLYAGTLAGVLRTTDGGATWNDFGLTEHGAFELLLNDRGDLIAATNSGIFRRRPDAMDWETLGEPDSSDFNWSLAYDNDEEALYAVGREGICYRLGNTDRNWLPVSTEPIPEVNDLAVDSTRALMFAATRSGVYSSDDRGATWTPTSLAGLSVSALLLDEQQGVLFAVGGGSEALFRSDDSGATWASASQGLNALPIIGTVTEPGPGGQIYALTEGNRLYWFDAQEKRWAGFSGTFMAEYAARSFTRDEETGRLYAMTRSGILSAPDPRGAWSLEPERNLISHLFALLRQPGVGVAGVAPDGVRFWAIANGGEPWAWAAGHLNLPQAELLGAEGNTPLVLAHSGAIFQRAEVAHGALRPLPWLALRAEVWRGVQFAQERSMGTAAAVIGLFSLLVAIGVNRSRQLGLPLWRAMLGNYTPAHLKPETAAATLHDWQQRIQRLLWYTGSVTVSDLWWVPQPLRRHVLTSYSLSFPDQAMSLRGRSLRVDEPNNRHTARWLALWLKLHRRLRARGELSEADLIHLRNLQQILAKALQLEYIDLVERQTRVRSINRGPQLPITLPGWVSVLYLPNPGLGPDDIRDLYRGLGGEPDLTLVVLLEGPNYVRTMGAQLSVAATALRRPQTLIILERDDLLTILGSRNPWRTLFQRGAQQLERARFLPRSVGRAAEVATIKGQLSRGALALYGQRGVGKTTLLRCIQADLQRGGLHDVVLLDCRGIDTEAGFYKAYTERTGRPQARSSGELVAQLRNNRRQDRSLVLLLDHVDELIERQRPQGLLDQLIRLAEEQGLQLVLSGGRVVARVAASDGWRLRPFSLEPLKSDDLLAIALTPLDTLGVSFQGRRAIGELIVRRTEGSPTLAALVSRQLLALDERNGGCALTLVDGEMVTSSPDYVRSYLYIFWDWAEALERFVMLVAPRGPFEWPALWTALLLHGVRPERLRLGQALNNLVMAGLIAHDPPVYKLGLAVLDQMLAVDDSLERHIEQARSKLPSLVAIGVVNLELRLIAQGVGYTLTMHATLPDATELARGPFDTVLNWETLRATNDVEAYGAELQAGLFAAGGAVDFFKEVRTYALGARRHLRVRLMPPAELQAHHWEKLQSPISAHPLATEPMLLLSRFAAARLYQPALSRTPGFRRALVAVAAPKDAHLYGLQALDGPGELQRAVRALGSLPADTLGGQHGLATRETLADHLRSGYDLIYLMAHGSVKDGQPFTMLEDDKGNAVHYSAELLAQQISAGQPRLVFLASCTSVGDERGSAASGLGQLLAELGVPCVIAMQGNVALDTAQRFVAFFFTELLRDGFVDRAFTVARLAIRHLDDWWRPVLFTRLPDGRLWDDEGGPRQT